MTNCPNCGGVLTRTGDCQYCGTHVVPNLNIFYGDAFSYGSITEININVTDHYGKEYVIPLIGTIESVELSLNSPHEETEVEFTFKGRIRE